MVFGCPEYPSRYDTFEVRHNSQSVKSCRVFGYPKRSSTLRIKQVDEEQHLKSKGQQDSRYHGNSGKVVQVDRSMYKGKAHYKNNEVSPIYSIPR